MTSRAHHPRDARRVRGPVLVLAVTALSVVGLAAPIAAVEARLTSLPLGRGTAVISWTGASGASPTVTGIEGDAGRYRLAAHERLARFAPSGDVTGTIGPDAISGVIARVQYRGNRSTARATDDVTG